MTSPVSENGSNFEHQTTGGANEADGNNNEIPASSTSDFAADNAAISSESASVISLRSEQHYGSTKSIPESSLEGKEVEPLESNGLFSTGSQLKEWMLDLSKDATLRKLMVKFGNFFSHSYEINLALTGVFAQLAVAPIPLLYMYLFSADILLGSSYTSIYSILIQLRREVEERRSSIANFDSLLASTKAFMFQDTTNKPSLMSMGGGDWLRKGSPLPTPPPPLKTPASAGFISDTAVGELDLDAEFLKNVVVLEECVKELLAILVLHGSSDYDQICYI